jgi:hypothetical protein
MKQKTGMFVHLALCGEHLCLFMNQVNVTVEGKNIEQNFQQTVALLQKVKLSLKFPLSRSSNTCQQSSNDVALTNATTTENKEDTPKNSNLSTPLQRSTLGTNSISNSLPAMYGRVLVRVDPQRDLQTIFSSLTQESNSNFEMKEVSVFPEFSLTFLSRKVLP